MILYDYILSPSCYRVRLLAALLGVRLDLRAVDVHPGAEQRGEALLALNPVGTLPILVDGNLVLTESTAILTYLAALAGPRWRGGESPIGALRELEAALSARRRRGGVFLVGDEASIADIACFPHVALAPDGGVPLDGYPSIRLWMRALRGLPGFVEMPGIHRLHELLPEPGPQPEVVRVGQG